MITKKSPAELLVAVKPYLSEADFDTLRSYLWNAQMDFAKSGRQTDQIDWLKSRIKKIQEVLSEPTPYAYEDTRADVHEAEQLFFPPRERELRDTQPDVLKMEREINKGRYALVHSKPDAATIENRIDSMRSTPKHIWGDSDVG